MSAYDETEDPTISEEPNWQTIKADIEKLRADLTTLGQKSLAEGQEQLAEQLEQLRAKAAAVAAKVNYTGRSAQADLINYVRTNPITSVSGAFGLGILLSAFLSRRS